MFAVEGYTHLSQEAARTWPWQELSALEDWRRSGDSSEKPSIITRIQ
jgi:hypothetical protein